MGLLYMVYVLTQQGCSISRHCVRRLMRLIGITAIYQKPRTSERHPEHKIYPYLLKNLEINYSNQAWSSYITFISIFKVSKKIYRSLVSLFKQGPRLLLYALFSLSPIPKLWSFKNYVEW
ncbi:MAG TPA: hypothetical protein DEZ09_04165 [Holosporales bacterium]|nr:hypothetical protein [Holosporales bacterium]